jgi:diguanylate cyclase (GGDEF)-like protein
MLSSVITSIRMRYAFAGAMFGSIFTSCGLAYDATFVNRSATSLTDLFQANPIHGAMALVPVILGYTFFKVGESRARLVDELTLRRQAEESLKYNAFHDSLTGLGNRHALECDVGVALQTSIGEGHAPALLLLDLDKFKFINDTMGHTVGDEILLALSARLREAAGPSHRLYRLGGDEFVIFWQGAPERQIVTMFCTALMQLISFPFDINGIKLAAGGSVGVTWLDAEDRSMSDVLRRADLALYRSKEVPGSHFSLYDRALAYEAEQRMQMEKDIRLALEQKAFFLEYQPIVDLTTNRVKGFEALLRWQFGDVVVRPDMFIPVAEKSGLIVPLGKWVLAEACAEAVNWPEDVDVSVNVAGEQFKDRAFVDFVKQVLADTGLAASRLTIEVTESLFTVHVDTVRDCLTELHDLGIRLALDDFGTGFSSINHLRSFPIDNLKIDKSFTDLMLDNQREAELVSIILQLSRAFNMTTTIEGVETARQLEFIRAQGAGNVQGFLISRPVAQADVLAFIARQASATAIDAERLLEPQPPAEHNVRRLRA